MAWYQSEWKALMLSQGSVFGLTLVSVYRHLEDLKCSQWYKPGKIRWYHESHNQKSKISEQIETMGWKCKMKFIKDKCKCIYLNKSILLVRNQF